MKEASFAGQQLGPGGIKYSRVFSILDHILLFIYLFQKKLIFGPFAFLSFPITIYSMLFPLSSSLINSILSQKLAEILY